MIVNFMTIVYILSHIKGLSAENFNLNKFAKKLADAATYRNGEKMDRIEAATDIAIDQGWLVDSNEAQNLLQFAELLEKVANTESADDFNEALTVAYNFGARCGFIRKQFDIYHILTAAFPKGQNG